MKIFNITFYLIAAAFLFTATSCKKDKATEVSCTVKSVRSISSTALIEYDASGFITTKTDSASGTYTLYTTNDTLLTQQGYTATGATSGSPHYYIINAEGLIVESIGSDTTFYTYNSNEQLIKATTGSGANLTGWTINTFAEDNLATSVVYDALGNITRTVNIDYYTDMENKGNLNFIYSYFSDNRYGKSTKNLIRKVQTSNGGTIKYNTLSYNLDANGYVTDFNLLTQPDNTYISVALGYSCN